MNKWIGYCLIAIAILSICITACSAPVSNEQYVSGRDVDAWGRYPFEVDFSDTTVAYSLDIYAVFTCRDAKFSQFTTLPLHVLWQSPGGDLYEEEAEISGESTDWSSHFTKTVSLPFRSGMRPHAQGMWKMNISVQKDTATKYGLEGLGLRVTRKSTS